RKMHQSNVMAAHQVGEDECALDVDRVGHCGVEFARLQSAIADAVEDGAEADAIEERPHADSVLGILRANAGRDEFPSLVRPYADDLAGILAMEVMEGVVTRDAGDAGDEQWQAMAQH